MLRTEPQSREEEKLGGLGLKGAQSGYSSVRREAGC